MAMTDKDRVLEAEVLLQGYAHWSLGYIRGTEMRKWRTACGAVAPVPGAELDLDDDAPSYFWHAPRPRCPTCFALSKTAEFCSVTGGDEVD